MSGEPPSDSASSAPSGAGQSGSRRLLRGLRDVRWLALLLAIGITAAILLLHDQLAHLGAYGYPGLFLVSFIGNATIIFPAPSLAVVFAAGGNFFPPLVGLAAGSGETLGELTGYLAGISGQAIIENQAQYIRMQRWMRRYGLWVIFALGLIPNPLFDLAGIAAGTMRIPVWRFLIACWPGKMIKTMAAAFLGAQAITLVETLRQALFH